MSTILYSTYTWITVCHACCNAGEKSVLRIVLLHDLARGSLYGLSPNASLKKTKTPERQTSWVHLWRLPLNASNSLSQWKKKHLLGNSASQQNARTLQDNSQEKGKGIIRQLIRNLTATMTRGGKKRLQMNNHKWWQHYGKKTGFPRNRNNIFTKKRKFHRRETWRLMSSQPAGMGPPYLPLKPQCAAPPQNTKRLALSKSREKVESWKNLNAPDPTAEASLIELTCWLDILTIF